MLDARMKQLAREGYGLKRKQADIITAEQENTLWEKGCLGTSEPGQLLDTLLYSIGLNFALRAGQEHRSLRVGPLSQIVLHSTKETRYLEYTEDVSKTNSGGLKNKTSKPKVKKLLFSNPLVFFNC